MSGLDWQAPEFLSSNTSGDDYLASLASFLDGPDKHAASYPDLSIYGGIGSLPSLANASSPELTSDSGASPASSDGTNNIAVAPYASNASSRRSTASSAIPSSSSHQVSKPHDKRKGGPQTTQAIKDRRSSGTGKSATAAPHHSHPDGVEGDITRSASPEDDGADGKKGGKKTSEKRKAQNRAAQRNFRERKEKHLKDLEDKVGALEAKANDQEAENSALKQLLQQLKSENDRLKVYESAFSFSYEKDVNNSTTMPTSSTFDSRPPLPATSSSSTNNDSPNASFSFDNSSFDLPASHAPNPSSSLAYTSSSFPEYPLSSSVPASADPALFPDNLFLNSLTVPPSTSSLSSTGESPISPATNASSSSTRSSSYVATPPTGAAPDLFASYRDPLADLSLPSAPLATLGDFDQLFGTQPPVAYPFEDPMAQFIKSPSPLNDSINLSTPPTAATPAAVGQHEKKKVTVTGEAGCPYGLIEGEKYEFDLDNLCHEMKLKATCQEAARQALASAMAEDAKISRSAYPAQL